MNKDIYLDYAAATPIHETVLNETLPYFCERYGNPSSAHAMGREAKEAVEESRRRISLILNCKPSEIVLTGGGTESIALAIKGVSKLLGNSKRKHIVTTQIEHAAVITSCEELSDYGIQTSYVAVNKNGIVDINSLKNEIDPSTLLVSVMYANNEIGTIQPISEISKIAHAKGALMHTDACQAAGYLNLDVKKLGVDLLTINGSKIYGPKGVGVLYVKEGTPISPLYSGGGQEDNLRGGTENVAGIVGMASALELVNNNSTIESERVKKLQGYFIDALINSNIKVIGDRINRLPNNVNLQFVGHDAQNIIARLDANGIYCSMGSACSATKTEPSHVLMAVGLSYHEAFECVRFTLGMSTTLNDIKFVIKVLKDILGR